jgi:uncharacterized protein (DUF433 family)
MAGIRPGQCTATLRLRQTSSSTLVLRADVTTDLLSRITIDIAQCGGRPCIRGMRMRVSDILELLSSGASFEEVLEDYPHLEREDILAAIQYVARQTDHPVLLSA